MKREAGFRADDGTWFPTAKECKVHEYETILNRLANMTAGQVKAAINRTQIEGIGANVIELANAIEFAGKLIAEKRRAMGGVKRKKKTVAEKSAEGAAIAVAKQAEAASMIAEVGAKQAKKK